MGRLSNHTTHIDKPENLQKPKIPAKYFRYCWFNPTTNTLFVTISLQIAHPRIRAGFLPVNGETLNNSPLL
jgi:hypothetical protein